MVRTIGVLKFEMASGAEPLYRESETTGEALTGAASANAYALMVELAKTEATFPTLAPALPSASVKTLDGTRAATEVDDTFSPVLESCEADCNVETMAIEGEVTMTGCWPGTPPMRTPRPTD